MSPRARVQQEPAFLLHHRPFRDSSRILDLYTRDQGRISLFAHGARGGKNGWAALLRPFTELLISYSGSSDGGTLSAAESPGVPASLPPERLLSGFYLNELLLKLVPRADPHPELYECYAQTLSALTTEPAEARVLRLFEKRLLDALGYGVDYSRVESTGQAVRPDAYYHVRPERGVESETLATREAHVYQGAHLLALAAETLEDPASLASARELLAQALAGPLEGRALGSRTVARALRDLKQGPVPGRRP